MYARRHNTLLSKDMQNAAYIWHVFWADVGKFFATNAIVAFISFRSPIPFNELFGWGGVIVRMLLIWFLAVL